MALEVPPLPYDYSALEPHIDEQTMRVHHDKHHQAYVDNANKALEGTEWADRSVDDILADLDVIPEDKRMAVRNNVGGHANHSLFWEIMGPNGGGEPSGSLGDAINSTFGSFAACSSSKMPRWKVAPRPAHFLFAHSTYLGSVSKPWYWIGCGSFSK